MYVSKTRDVVPTSREFLNEWILEALAFEVKWRIVVYRRLSVKPRAKYIKLAAKGEVVCLEPNSCSITFPKS
jgi:hypothetical protein